MLAQHQHVQDWNGPSNPGDIKDYSRVGTILTLFFYSIEKVVEISQTVLAHGFY